MNSAFNNTYSVYIYYEHSEYNSVLYKLTVWHIWHVEISARALFDDVSGETLCVTVTNRVLFVVSQLKALTTVTVWWR